MVLPLLSSLLDSLPILSTFKAEKKAIAYSKEQVNSPELVIMRPTLVLGPGDSRFSSITLVHEFLKKNIPIVPPGGLSYVDVRDTADAFIAGMTKGVPGHAYLLGASNVSHSQFYNTLQTVSGVQAPSLRFPISIILFLLRLLYFFTWSLFGFWIKEKDPVFVEMGGVFWSIDSSRAKKELGFAPRNPHDTLRDTIIYLRTLNKY